MQKKMQEPTKTGGGDEAEDSEWRAAMTFMAKGPSASLEFLPPEQKNLVYAYKAQALDGPCPSSQDGSLAIDHVLRAKQQAWKALGHMPRSQAKREFVNLLTQLLPAWRDWYGAFSQQQQYRAGISEQASEGSDILREFIRKHGNRASL